MLGQDRAFERLKQRQMGFTAGKARWWQSRQGILAQPLR
jgi:hypothetical protein